MAAPRRVPALAVVILLVLAAALADEPASSLDVAEGQTPEPVSPAKLEASGESDLSTPAQRAGKGLTPSSFVGDARRETPGSDSSSSLEPPPSDSSGTDPLARGGLVGGLQAQSNESEEGLERDTDSEEALASQGI